jgi:hypothetical protein
VKLAYDDAMVGQTSYTTSDEWRHALDVAEAVKQTAASLTLEPKHAWLRQVLEEAAGQMRAAVIWAAAKGSAMTGHPAGTRPLIVAADAARGDAALASYFLSFLAHQHQIPGATAASLGAQLDDVETGMDALSRRLRDEAGVDPYFSS